MITRPLPHIRFAPLHIPLHRRLETLAVAFAASMFFLCIAFQVILFWHFSWTVYGFMAYLAWIYMDTSIGKPVAWLRRAWLWKYLRNYFPCQLIKEIDLDPTRNYVFGYHPHGIISTGMWINFCTEANLVSKVFPGVHIHPLTLHGNLQVPVWREILLAHGIRSVKRESFHHILQSGPGTSVMVVPGGAREALDAHPGTVDLTLQRRRGFIRVALENGADLVPVLSFGENDIFQQVNNQEGSWLRWWQQFLLQRIGFAPCMPYGRGVFNYDFGLLPQRKPIVTVVGKPIQVDKPIPAPSNKDVERYQTLYIAELFRIYHEYKDRFHQKRTRELLIVR